MTDLCPFATIRPGDADAVGGKGLSLGLLAAAGLPVPAGFCLTTAVHRRLRGQPLSSDPSLVAAIEAACRALGAGPVAVRSSATAEDSAAASFAGQQETVLGVTARDDILRAIEQCWASLDSSRAGAYRLQQGIREEAPAMAVVVQRLVPAEVAGVLFTRDPTDPRGDIMLVEASWGLGETVVSGEVTPDRYHLDRASGRLLERHVAVKTLQRTACGDTVVPLQRQALPCLEEKQLVELAELGRRVEAYFGDPRDIEWAYADGRFWLLQARPITASASEREAVRREEIAVLRTKASPEGTVWARYNLAEVLPAPTPMTWSVVQRFLMSGKGGYGLMVRDLGFDPDPALDEEGIFDLVAGRPYCNLSREARVHDRVVPFEHPFAALRADPRRAFYPVPRVNPARFPWHFWLLLPITLPRIALRFLLGGIRRDRLVRTFAERFRREIVPAFLHQVEADRRVDLTRLDDAAIVAFFAQTCRRTLVEFARDSLKPTALAMQCMASLERKLSSVMPASQARTLTRTLCMGVAHDPETDLATALRWLKTGTLAREQFLERFGHRGPDEMELSRPRWREMPELLDDTGPPGAGKHPVGVEERLEAETRLGAEQRRLLMDDVKVLHGYLALRESAKHYLLAGHEQIRRALVELDRRHRLHGGIFYLTPDELPALLRGEDLVGVITRRRRRRALALGLEVPDVLFSDDLEAIGRPLPAPPAAETWQGIGLSAGIAEAPAFVLEHPQGATPPAEGYVLVCPSTDPAWVPLFVGARALVMETGGVLSHGAIVAREFGLPAVAGLPAATRRLRTGQRLRVDGAQGTVVVLSEDRASEPRTQ